MQLSMFKSTIHRATVTHADIDYEGSVTMSGELMDAAGILEHEHVHVWNIARGTRFETYALRGDENSGIICINGAAAHLANINDLVIIATFTLMDEAQAKMHEPKVVLVDEKNRIKNKNYHETPGPFKVQTSNQ